MLQRILICIFCCTLATNKTQAEQLIQTLLPNSGFEKNWLLTDSIKVYPGNELFTYMDGGAEVYMEYGFQKIAVGQYRSGEKNIIQCEVYQMADSTGAYGNFTFYQTDGVKPIGIGTDGIYNDYYLVFWKGRYLVVVSSPSPNAETLANLKVLAAVVSNNITNVSNRPVLVEKLIKSGIQPIKIKYFMGRNGMNNFFRFVPGNAFDSNHALALQKENSKIIINEYGTNELAKKALEEALQKISKLQSNKKFESDGLGFRYYDSGNNAIICLHYKRFIIITISNPVHDNSSIGEIIEILE